MAATSWKAAGYCAWCVAREIETTPASKGSRNASNTRRSNSGISGPGDM